MSGRHGPPRPNPETGALALLGVLFVVVALLLGQAVLALRSHERVVQTSLEDLAGFAAERVAEELNATFSSIFLDRIAAARTAHDAWIADRGAEGDGRVGPDPRLPADAIPLYFSLDGGRVVALEGGIDDETRTWILADVLPHAEGTYPRPAPYALLRGSGGRAIVYRKEQYYGTTSVYGFVVRFDRLESVYARLLGDLSILPRSLADAPDPEALTSIRLSFPQGDQTLFVRPGADVPYVVRARAFAAKAGRMAVDVGLDGTTVRALIPGGYPNDRLPVLVALALLTFGLLAFAVVLTRRAARLRELREVFVANASHDLRTPLAQIRMFSETLLLGRMRDPDERDRALEVIRRQAEHLGDLVENILHASDGGGRPVRRAGTELDTLLEQTLAALTPAVRAREATVVHRREGPEVAEIDGPILRRIVTNLVDNALKFGPPGQTITVHLRNDAGLVEVRVDDEGSGVPPRERNRVWERFERLDGRHPATTGTGLGLSVVRELALRHGGSVRIEDAPGGGARVVVTLSTLGEAA